MTVASYAMQASYNFGNYSAAIGMDFESSFRLDRLGKELTRCLSACQISQNFPLGIKMR